MAEQAKIPADHTADLCGDGSLKKFRKRIWEHGEGNFLRRKQAFRFRGENGVRRFDLLMTSFSGSRGNNARRRCGADWFLMLTFIAGNRELFGAYMPARAMTTGFISPAANACGEMAAARPFQRNRGLRADGSAAAGDFSGRETSSLVTLQPMRFDGGKDFPQSQAGILHVTEVTK
jgi:hypothetical protein